VVIPERSPGTLGGSGPALRLVVLGDAFVQVDVT
jgi:hypothetical protein